MGRHRQLVIGLIMLIGGLLVVATGTIFPSSDPLVALGWLLFVPFLVCLCGSIFVFVALARSSGRVRRSAAVFRIIALAGVAGLGLAFGWGAAGVISQVPDSMAGLNGPFIPGSAPGISAFVLSGLGLATGLVVGALGALVWWSFRGQRLPAESFSRR